MQRVAPPCIKVRGVTVKMHTNPQEHAVWRTAVSGFRTKEHETPRGAAGSSLKTFTVNPHATSCTTLHKSPGVYCESAPNAGILHPANCGQTWRQPGFKKFSDYPGKQCRWGLRPVLPCRFPSGPPEASVPHCAWHRILRQAESCCGYRRLPGQRKSGH